MEMWPVFMFQLILQFIGHISTCSFRPCSAITVIPPDTRGDHSYFRGPDLEFTVFANGIYNQRSISCIP